MGLYNLFRGSSKERVDELEVKLDEQIEKIEKRTKTLVDELYEIVADIENKYPVHVHVKDYGRSLPLITFYNSKYRIKYTGILSTGLRSKVNNFNNLAYINGEIFELTIFNIEGVKEKISSCLDRFFSTYKDEELEKKYLELKKEIEENYLYKGEFV